MRKKEISEFFSNSSPDQVLKAFYQNLYLREKHDSPDESRTSIIRRIKEMVLQERINPKIVLNIGSGPQALEKKLLFTSQGRQTEEKLKDYRFITLDVSNIRHFRLLCRGKGREGKGR